VLCRVTIGLVIPTMSETRVRVFACIWWLLLAGLVIGCVDRMTEKGLSLLGFANNGIDDANIYFRYAHNLLSGHGFVWNVGGERVEGVSSLLWLLVCIVAESLSTYPERALLRCNIFVVAFSVWAAIATVTYVVLTRHSVSRCRYLLQGCVISATVTALMVWWLEVNPPFIVWTVLSLMDTGVWSALVTILGCSTTCYAVSGRALFRNAAYVTLVLLPICRPEGVAVAALGVALLLMAEWGRGLVVDRSRRFMARTVWIGALSIVSLFSVRWFYFGFLFPNTYYAKVDGELWFNVYEGWGYLVRFAEHYPFVWKAVLFLAGMSVVVAVIDLFLWLLGSPRRHPSTFVIWGFLVLVGGVVPLWVGGDHFTWWRFLQPYWVPLYVGLLLFADRIVPAVVPPALRVLVVSPVVVACVVFQSPNAGERWEDFNTRFAPSHEFIIANAGRSTGTDLNEVFAQYDNLPVVGGLAMGGLGRSYRGPINDLLALNNVEMAHASRDRKSFFKSHSAFNSEVFLRQRPAFLFFMDDYCSLASPERTLETKPFYARAMRGLHESAEFKELYVPVVVWNERLHLHGQGLCGYALREELAAGKPIFGYRAL